MTYFQQKGTDKASPQRKKGTDTVPLLPKGKRTDNSTNKRQKGQIILLSKRKKRIDNSIFLKMTAITTSQRGTGLILLSKEKDK